MRNVCAVFALSLVVAIGASAATFTVTNTNDSGSGSLRQAIGDANASAISTGVPATISFGIGSGVQTIAPLTALSVAANVTIDGTTQPGYAGTPLIELDDSLIATGGTASCLDSAGTIRGLAINRCSGRGISMNGGRVTACFIGTDVTGHTARANNIGIIAAGLPAMIGGVTDAEGNVISGNQRNITVAAAGTEIAHNRIGTDSAGEAPPFPFNGGAAIFVDNAHDVTIHDNVIGGQGVAIDCSLAQGVLINRNRIGISVSNQPMPDIVGIHLNRTDQAQIGTGGANIIAYGTLAGIEIDGSSSRNTIRGNSIHHNGSMGIDLSVSSYVDGVTLNDSGDSDGGPNLLQNYPILTNVTSAGGQTTISGTINTNANQLISLDFYASGQCSNSGNGEGETPLGASSVQTDGNGNASFTATFATSLVAGSVVTATATDPFGNTSEFSACRTLQGNGKFIVNDSALVNEAAGSVTITVQRTNDAAGTASVHYATANGTASSGSDYTAASGVLFFADGEVTKSFIVPITNDGTYEGNEAFTVTLSGATNGTSIGTPSTETITIVDNEKPPALSIADASLYEGNSGTTNMTFTVTLTAATALPVTVRYGTDANSAYAGTDFQTVGGLLTFNPGELQKTIDVPVFGDTVIEGSEVFFVSLGSPVNATVARGTATGLIINDDGTTNIVSVADVRVVEGNSGTTNAVITLIANQPFSGEIDFFTVDGTAKAGLDYTPRTTFVNFNNETVKTITVPIIGDTLAETDETFTVQLSMIPRFPVLGFTLSRPFVTVTIANDDQGVGPTRLIIPAGGSLPLQVTLGGVPANQAATFTSSNPNIATVPGSVLVTGSAIVNVTGVRAGDATITATLPAGFGPPVTIDVFVYDAANLVLSPASVRLPIGSTATISASFDPPLTVAEEATLSTSGLSAITFPNSISVGPGQTTTFTIKGVAKGHLFLNATLGTVRANTVSSITIDVIDPVTSPIITQVSPSNGSAAGGTSVTISGANFRTDCTIRFGGVPVPNVTSFSSTSMTAITPAHASGAVDVSLTCSTDAFTLGNAFTYVAQPPTLSSVAPSFGTTAGNTLVTIAGTNIASGCWPFFDGIAARAAIANGSAEMIAATPAHAAAATVPVVLRCAAAGAGVSLNNAFTYSSADDSSPVITGVDPLVGSSGKTVTISGARFRLDDSVTFDAVPAKVLSSSAGTHVVRIPDVSAGKTSITVTDAGGHASTTGPIFTMTEPQPPQITGVTPATTRPANEVTLDGSGFRPGYAFTIGDQSAVIVTMTYTRVVLRVPQLNAGSYTINALNSSSVIAAVGPQLSVLAAGLAVTRVSPVCTTTVGGGPLTITGSGFVTGASVTFDGTTATAAVVDAQTIAVTLPPLPVGSPRVVVTNPSGDAATLTSAFSATSPFDPSGCSPRSRPTRH